MTTEKKRVQIDFKTSTYKKLKELQSRSGENTITDTIKLALALLDQALICVEQRGEVLFRNKDGEIVKPMFIGRL